MRWSWARRYGPCSSARAARCGLWRSRYASATRPCPATSAATPSRPGPSSVICAGRWGRPLRVPDSVGGRGPQPGPTALAARGPGPAQPAQPGGLAGPAGSTGGRRTGSAAVLRSGPSAAHRPDQPHRRGDSGGPHRARGRIRRRPPDLAPRPLGSSLARRGRGRARTERGGVGRGVGTRGGRPCLRQPGHRKLSGLQPRPRPALLPVQRDVLPAVGRTFLGGRCAPAPESRHRSVSGRRRPRGGGPAVRRPGRPEMDTHQPGGRSRPPGERVDRAVPGRGRRRPACSSLRHRGPAGVGTGPGRAGVGTGPGRTDSGVVQAPRPVRPRCVNRFPRGPPPPPKRWAFPVLPRTPPFPPGPLGPRFTAPPYFPRGPRLPRSGGPSLRPPARRRTPARHVRS